jgi:hypothetical protein
MYVSIESFGWEVALTPGVQLITDEGIALDKLATQRMASNDDMLEVRVYRSIVEVFDNVVDDFVGGNIGFMRVLAVVS